MKTIAEVAKETGYSVRTLRGFASKGKIKSEFDGHRWLIPESEVKRLKKEKK